MKPSLIESRSINRYVEATAKLRQAKKQLIEVKRLQKIAEIISVWNKLSKDCHRL